MTSRYARPLVLGLLFTPGAALAADHAEAPGAAAIPTADIGDFYAWHTDGGKLVTIVTFATVGSTTSAPVLDNNSAERVAQSLHARFRLTADLDDLVSAKRWIERAYDHAPQGAGPHLTAAAVYTSLHKLDAAARAYDAASQRVLLPDDHRATITRGRAELALLSGDTIRARSLLDDAHSVSPGFLQTAAQARLDEKTRSPEEALALFQAAAPQLGDRDGLQAAWTDLQVARVANQLGDSETAVAAVEAAEHHLPGWFATDAARADLLLAEGERSAALDALRTAAERTPDPEYRARYAVLLAEDDLFAAEDLLREARTTMAEWSTLAPEGMATHAAELALTSGEAERALHLAQLHAREHQDVDALILLSRAHHHAGHPGPARDFYARATDGSWSTAEVARLCAAGGCPATPRGG